MTGLSRINYGLTVGSPYADKFKGLIEDLEANGVKIDPRQSGGYNYRNIAGTNRLSNHAYGRALDINWNDNARGTKGKIDPTLARTLAQKHGLVWGGDWSNPDPMHFEVAGALNAAGGQHNHSHASTASPPGTPGQPAPNAGAAPMAYAGATPDSVAQARKMAQALMSQGLSSAPVQHWTQALGRVLQAGVGSMWDSQAAQGETSGKAEAAAQLAEALKSSDPQTAVMGLSSPWLGDTRTQLAEAMLKNKVAPPAKPAAIQNYELIKGLPPEQQELFWKTQRGEQWKDIGTGYQNPVNKEILPKDNYSPARDKALGGELGKAQGDSAAALPGAEDATKIALDTIEKVRSHNGKGLAVGYGDLIPEWAATNTRVAGFRALRDQLKGQVFLDAYDKLRGAQGITNIEGEKATAAKARLSTAQTQEDFDKALDDLADILKKGLETARRKAQGVASPSAPKAGRTSSGLTYEVVE
jgi:hypothetical protein